MKATQISLVYFRINKWIKCSTLTAKVTNKVSLLQVRILSMENRRCEVLNTFNQVRRKLASVKYRAEF